MEKEDDVEDVFEKLKRKHKIQFEEYSNFVKEQVNKGECVCEKTFNILTEYSELFVNKNPSFKESLNWKYSSCKKIQPFDAVFCFVELEMTEDCMNISMIYTCEDEIENYSKSHRFFKFSDSLIQPSIYKSGFFVKVFEYKPSKI